VRAKLVVVQGKPLGREVLLTEGRFLIGRGADCHLRPASELVSRHHCVLTVTADSIRVEDLGSTNGTLLNGRRIEGEVQISQGDLLEVGPLAFALRVGEPEAAQPTPQPAAAAAPAPEISSTEIDKADESVIEWLLDDSQQDMGTTTIVMTEELQDEEQEPEEEKKEVGAEQKTPTLEDDDKKASASETATELMRKYYRHGRR